MSLAERVQEILLPMCVGVDIIPYSKTSTRLHILAEVAQASDYNRLFERASQKSELIHYDRDTFTVKLHTGKEIIVHVVTPETILSCCYAFGRAFVEARFPETIKSS